jgi:hypothetical protein
MARYRIRKGRHYNSSKVRLVLSTILGVVTAEAVRRSFMLNLFDGIDRYAYFTKECWHFKSDLEKDEKGNPMTGWNKLFGGSGFDIHDFSARAVWQPDFEKYGWITIALYTYNNGVWSALPVKSVPVCSFVRISVEKTDTGYSCHVDDTYRSDITEKNPLFIVAEPYFGGRSTAPHDMDIYLYNPLTYSLFGKYIRKRLSNKCKSKK